MKKVNKSWGWEHWFVNTAEYCGKLLFVNLLSWSSGGAYHYHKLKDETFFVIEGTLRVDYVNNKNEFKSIHLDKYDSFRIKRYMKHRFTALSDGGCKFIEASTTHSDDDSYRATWNENSETWDPVC